VIGEFHGTNGGGLSIKQKYRHAYDKGFAGAWAWSVNDGNWDSIKKGVACIAYRDDQSKGGLVKSVV